MAFPLRVLLTGFEPFGGSPVNPSQQLVARLSRARVPGLHLHAAVLPVVGGEGAGSAWAALRSALSQVNPHAVVCFGEAHTRSAVSIERIAVNLLDYRVADNAGARVVDQPVVPGAPAAHMATLPVREMMQCVQAAGVPCELSLSAGTFLCNEIMYRVLEHAARERMPFYAGFVHLPQLPEQRAVRETAAAPMGLETMERGGVSLLRALSSLSAGGVEDQAHRPRP